MSNVDHDFKEYLSGQLARNTLKGQECRTEVNGGEIALFYSVSNLRGYDEATEMS